MFERRQVINYRITLQDRGLEIVNNFIYAESIVDNEGDMSDYIREEKWCEW